MPFSLRKRRRILTSYECWEETGRGKGSHTLFKRKIGGNVFSYPIPLGKKKDEIKDCYVKGIRKKFRLTPDDGVTDDDFFGRT